MNLQITKAVAVCLLLSFPTMSVCADTETAGTEPAAVGSAITGLAIGDQAPAFELTDFRGKAWSSEDFGSADVLVVAFVGTECPLVKLYSGRLAALAADWQDRGVAFLAIDANQQDSMTELAHFARTHELNFPLLKDAGNVVADQFGAERTPEVFVLDRERRLRYHGRIDDQYTYGIQKPTVTHDYLAEAITALAAGEEVQIAQTEVVGCLIGKRLEADENSEVTYSNQIARIFQRRCVECHRTGEIAPFALTEYEEAVGWAEMIAEVVNEQRMPPWHASPKHGSFQNDSRLTDEELQLINQWVEAGAPQGKVEQLPPPQTFVEGWRIGEPDLVLYMSDEPFAVPAEGEVKYQHFVIDPGFTEDKWIKAAECRPGNRAVVHHIIVASASKERLSERVHGEISSDWLTATAPGALPMSLPKGMAKFVPAGSRLVFQLHYTPNGTPQTDRSSVGLIFADPEEVEHEVVTQKAANGRFQIPPGAEAHRVEAEYRFPKDSLMLALFPHMHLRGKSFSYTAHYPDGDSEVLLDVPHYDFNWQNSYVLQEPKVIPKGTRLHCVAHFDNSDQNLANPDPTQTVRWGDQTWEEMMIGYFDVALLDPPPKVTKQQRRTDQFLADVPSKRELPTALVEAGREGLRSEAALADMFAELRKLAPQVDRVDWMTLDGNWLTIRLAAEDKTRATGRAAAAGKKVPKVGLELTKYIEDGQHVVQPDTSQVKAPDFQLMSRLFAASLHHSYSSEEENGLISFWSEERDAFPPVAVDLLHQLGEILVDSRKSTDRQ